jgi:hypothetical protein
VAPVVVAAAEPQQPDKQHEQATYQTASLGSTFSSRAVWTVGAQPATTGTTSEPLAYAATDALPAMPRARPMGKGIPTATPETKLIPAAANTSVAVTTSPPPMFGDLRANSPWLRAAMLTPSVHNVMTATPLGVIDPRPLTQHFSKPVDALTMTFSVSATRGLEASRFSGNAVVFLATTTFVKAKTASLR